MKARYATDEEFRAALAKVLADPVMLKTLAALAAKPTRRSTDLRVSDTQEI